MASSEPRARAGGPAAWCSFALFALMAGLELSGAYGVLEAKAPLSPYTALLGVAVLAVLYRAIRHGLPWRWPVLVSMGAYLVAVTISALESPLSPAVVAEGVDETLKSLVFLAVMCLLGAGMRTWMTTALAIVVPTAFIGWFSGVNEFVLGNAASLGGFDTVTTYLGVGTTAARHAGSLPDPNFWGRILVVALAFACALVAHAWQRHRSGVAGLLPVVLALGAVGGELVGIYLTGSRGSFFSAGISVLAFVLLLGVPWRRVAAVALAAVPLVLVTPGLGSRILSTAEVASSGQQAAVDGSILERVATQRVATAMFEARPVTGVGPMGYFPAFPDYSASTGQQLARVVAPHNTYLERLAETGLVGLVTFLALCLTCLALGLAAIRRLRTTASMQERAATLPYAAAATAGILAWMVASVFLHLTYFRVLLLLFAMTSVMASSTRQRVQSPPPPLLTRERLRAGVAPAAAAVLAGGTAAALLLSQPPTYVAERVGHLMPTSDSTYLLDLRTRGVVLPTFAVVIGSGKETVNSQGDPASGSVTVTTTGTTPQQAEAAARSATGEGTDRLTALGMTNLYYLDWGPVQTSPQDVSAATLSGGVAVAGGVAAFVVSRLQGFLGRRRNRGGNTTTSGGACHPLSGVRGG